MDGVRLEVVRQDSNHQAVVRVVQADHGAVDVANLLGTTELDRNLVRQFDVVQDGLGLDLCLVLGNQSLSSGQLFVQGLAHSVLVLLTAVGSGQTPSTQVSRSTRKRR